MGKDELKPCPFCGVKPKIDGEFVVIDHKWTCHLRSESFIKNKANIEVWNRRTS